MAVMGSVHVIRQVTAYALRAMATAAHPHNRSHQAKFIHAVRYLRRRKLWIRDGSKPSWGVPGEAA
jgi:hypothetical protein